MLPVAGVRGEAGASVCASSTTNKPLSGRSRAGCSLIHANRAICNWLAKFCLCSAAGRPTKLMTETLARLPGGRCQQRRGIRGFTGPNYFLDAYQRLRRTLAPADAAYLLLAGGAEPGARAGAEVRRRWTELRQQAENGPLANVPDLAHPRPKTEDKTPRPSAITQRRRPVGRSARQASSELTSIAANWTAAGRWPPGISGRSRSQPRTRHGSARQRRNRRGRPQADPPKSSHRWPSLTFRCQR